MNATTRLSDWLNNAHEGDQFVYWRTRNQDEWATRRSSGMPTPKQREFSSVIAAAAEFAELGRIALFQRKLADWQHEWIAVRLSSTPPNALLTNPERAARSGLHRRAA